MAAAHRRDAGLWAVGQSTQLLPSPAVPSLTPSCSKPSPCIPPGLCFLRKSSAWGATMSPLVSPSVVPTPPPSLFWLQGAALLSEHPSAAREPGQQHPPGHPAHSSTTAGLRALKFGAARGSPLLSGSQGHSQARGGALSLLPFPASPEAVPSPALVFHCKAKGHGVPAPSPRRSSSTALQAQQENLHLSRFWTGKAGCARGPRPLTAAVGPRGLGSPSPRIAGGVSKGCFPGMEKAAGRALPNRAYPLPSC